jgi:cell fate (sporulation/competence/biofilm development) regulator YlbF (YheA/YmcA/DUF963 family)
MPTNPFGNSASGSYFASLYSAVRSNKNAVQAAADQDAFDQWQNGLMDDQTWLAYIATRISQTASDPTQHEKWVTAQRKYVTQIADNQAEFAYQNGGNIGDLITYYTRKMGGLNSGSQEYRNVQLRLNDLMDTRSANDITDGSQRIQDQINAGTASYSDLLRFYRDHLSALRPSSALYKQVTSEIEKVTETLRVNTLNGEFEKLQYQYETKKLTGKAYAAQLRTMAEQFKVNDPQKYYQILEAANKLSASPGLYGGSGGSGGGGTSRANAIDLMQAQTQNLYQLIDQFDSGQSTGTDRAGTAITFTPEMVKAIDQQIVDSLNATGAAYDAKGDHSAAAHAYLQASQYVTGDGRSPGAMQQHNTLPVSQQAQTLMLNASKALAQAAMNPDPSVLTTTAQTISNTYQTFVQGLTAKATGETVALGEGQYGRSGTTGLTPTDLATPEFIAQQTAIANALATVTAYSTYTTPPDDATVQAAFDLIRQAFPNKSTPENPSAEANAIINMLVNPALRGPATQQGLRDGSVVQIADPSGFTVVGTRQADVSVLDPNGNPTWQTKNVPVDSKGNDITGLVDVYVDVNGQPTRMMATVQESASPLGGVGFVATKKLTGLPSAGGISGDVAAGSAIDYRLVEQWQKDGTLDRLRALGQVDIAPALPMKVVVIPAHTAVDGTFVQAVTFAQDPDTHLWYKNDLPVRGAQRIDGQYVKWDSTQHKWLFDWKAYSSADGVSRPYVGGNDRMMQAYMDAHPEIFFYDEDGNPVGTRDATGTVSWDPLAARDQLQYMYYDATMPGGSTKSEMVGIRADALLMRDQLAARTASNSVTGDTRSEMSGVASDVMKGISDLAKSLGIGIALAGGGQPDLFAPRQTPSTGASNFDTRSEALGGATSIPTGLRSILPVSEFDPAEVKTYSGPTITGTVAPKIDSVVPTTPLVTIPRPVPAYTPPSQSGDTYSESAGIARNSVAQLRNPQIYPSSWDETLRGGV